MDDDLLPRRRLLARLKQSVAEFPVTVLLGARQIGKSTLAAAGFGRSRSATFFDLERTADFRALANPELALAPLDGIVVIDEVQRQPGLFAALRPLADRRGTPARFVLLGSASPGLMRGVSESLAGRAQSITVDGFDLDEVGAAAWPALWLRGGFPRSFLAATDAASLRWRAAFIATFLDRDLPQLGIRIPAETLRRFWMMIAHYHGQIWNASELARSLGTNEKTARHYLDLLAGTFVVRILPPWFENLGKRLVKSPKIYIRDSGLLHVLLDIDDAPHLRGHAKVGASWEGFAVEQVLARWETDRAWFWSTYQGAELDLLVEHAGRRYGFEFKHSDAPTATRSMQTALEDLKLKHLWVVYPGTKSYALSPDITVVPIDRLPDAP